MTCLICLLHVSVERPVNEVCEHLNEGDAYSLQIVEI